jgi:hypothetical protein
MYICVSPLPLSLAMSVLRMKFPVCEYEECEMVNAKGQILTLHVHAFEDPSHFAVLVNASVMPQGLIDGRNIHRF